MIESRQQSAGTVCIGRIAAVFLMAVCFAAPYSHAVGMRESETPHLLVGFGSGRQNRVQFDSTTLDNLDSTVLIAFSRKDRTLSLLSVSDTCQPQQEPQVLADDVLPSRKPGALTITALGDKPLILFGALRLEGLIGQRSGWQRFTLVKPEDSGILRHRAVAAKGDVAHVAMLEWRRSKRQHEFDARGRVRLESSKREETLRYLSVTLNNVPQIEQSELVPTPVDIDGPESLSIQVNQGIPAILLAYQRPGETGQLDLYKPNGHSWITMVLRRFSAPTPPLVHLDEKGNAYSRREGVGLYRIRLDKHGAGSQTDAWDDWSPELLRSASGLLAWTDTRRAGKRWWGRVPFHQLWNPNTSPKWLNNDIVINRDNPRVLTPWPVRVEQFRVHRLDQKLIVLWLGYRNFSGQSELFAQEPLGLFCQHFDWNAVQ